jgi:ABC-type Fe3+-hydroxamate transport system substrate-binding protein
MKKILSIVLAMVLLASAVPLAITPAAADIHYEIPMDADENDELTKEELVNAILPYMLDEGAFTLDEVGDAAYVYAYWDGEPKTVTDMIGREAAFYRPVERVVSPFTMFTRILVALGACDKLVGVSYSCVMPEEEHACGGKLLKISDVCPFGKNVELIASLKPDVLFGEAYICGGPANMQEKVDALVLSAKPKGETAEEQIYSGCTFMGEVLDMEESAEDLISFVKEKFDLVTDVTSQIPDSEKPKACFVSGKGQVSTVSSDPCSPTVEEAGGITVKQTYGTNKISVEQAIAWNPDVIFITRDRATGRLTREQVL